MLFFAFVDVFLSLEAKYQKILNNFGFVVTIISDELQLLQIFKSFQQSCKIITFDTNNVPVFSLKMHLLILKAPDHMLEMEVCSWGRRLVPNEV